MKIDPVADETMVKNAVGEEAFDELAEPPNVAAPMDHALWPAIHKALKTIYDPEIPVNIYELGLIYEVKIDAPKPDGKSDIHVKMTLTSPGCPVAQEMPLWIQGAIMPLDNVGEVDVEVIWDPPWTPAMMAETAKMQLNMFY
jgi:FeS assembly SUF system protein